MKRVRREKRKGEEGKEGGKEGGTLEVHVLNTLLPDDVTHR